MSSRRVTASAARQRRLGDMASGLKPPVSSGLDRARQSREAGSVLWVEPHSDTTRVSKKHLFHHATHSVFCLVFEGGSGWTRHWVGSAAEGSRSSGGWGLVDWWSGDGRAVVEPRSYRSDRGSFRADFSIGMGTVRPGSRALRPSAETRVTREADIRTVRDRTRSGPRPVHQLRGHYRRGASPARPRVGII